MATNFQPDDPTLHWTRQLYREFEEIAWYHKVSLRPPVIQIEDLVSRWGQWDPFFRSITLNKRLILEHSWDVVLEILKHEMAHQYVTEVLLCQADNTHGDAFGEACRRLGVAPWAAKAGGVIPKEIPSLRERVMTGDDERLLLKAEKLLALAQSGNEHEAVLAMQRVRELYAKYDIERLRANRSGVMDSLIICRHRKKNEPHEAMIYALLNEHFFVKVVHTSLYFAPDQTKYKAAELLGTRQNLLMSEYVFHFLLRQCERLWLTHKKATRCSGRLRRSYLLGVLHGFSEKLSAQAIQSKVAGDLGITALESKALVVLRNRELDDYVETRFPRLATSSRRSARVDHDMYARGKVAGQSITIHRGVTSGKAGFGGFLS